MRYSHTRRYMKFDIFVPCFGLAVEYKGEQYYSGYAVYGNSSVELERRMQEKRQVCRQLGISLIEIPYLGRPGNTSYSYIYWWDNQLNSLKSTVHLHRPDLMGIT